MLGKYRVESVIGRGGMGVVVKAWHQGLREQVAIKLLRDDVAIADETIARFVREAQAAVRLKSEHIARITDVGTFDDGKPYMVMELLEGQDIGQLIVERGRLQPSLAIDLVLQACEALAEAHSLGIVHRDIKPSNLFLTSHPDGSLLLKVLDFGISKAPGGAELSLTQTWSMLGSPAYMSPEQMRSARHVDARTDVWSLGAVLYEAVEGHLPFPAASFSEMCVMVAVDQPVAMRAAPPELAAIVLRCLRKAPDERYAHVAELGRDLARLAREPARAQIQVDRMTRLIGRSAIRRTPAAGVPIGSQFQTPATAPLPPTPMPVPPTPAPAPISPAALARAAKPAPVPFALAPSAAYPAYRGNPPPPSFDSYTPTPAPHSFDGYTPTPAPHSFDSYTPPPPMARHDLTMTHLVARRRRRGWLVPAAAFLALAAATAIIVIATRAGASSPAPARPHADRPAARPTGEAVKMTTFSDPAQ